MRKFPFELSLDVEGIIAKKLSGEKDSMRRTQAIVSIIVIVVVVCVCASERRARMHTCVARTTNSLASVLGDDVT
jgi:hypothetical protein